MTENELEKLKDKVKLNFYYDCFDYDGDEHTSLDLDGEYLISLIEAEQQRRVPSEDVQRAIDWIQAKRDFSTNTDDGRANILCLQALRQMQGWIPDKKGEESNGKR